VFIAHRTEKPGKLRKCKKKLVYIVCHSMEREDQKYNAVRASQNELNELFIAVLRVDREKAFKMNM